MPHTTGKNCRGFTPLARRRARFPGGIKSRQLGYGEDLFLLFICGIGLLFLVVYGLALWIGRGWIGKLTGVAIATAVLSPIWLPFAQSIRTSNKWQHSRETVARICEAEQAALPSSIATDSVLDDVDGLRSGDLQYLLSEVRLKFVEVRMKPGGKLTQNEDYPWDATQDKPYVHLQLGDSTSSDCYFPKNRNEKNFFTASSPIKPGTCLQVTYLNEPTATAQIVEVRDPASKGLSRWTLRDRTSGVVRAGISDAFRLKEYPSPQPGWYRRWPNPNQCETGISGYGMLLDHITGTDSSRVYNKKFVLDAQPLKTRGLPFSYLDVRKKREEKTFVSLGSHSVPFAVKQSEVRDQSTWEDAYQEALKRGAWVSADKLIQPQENRFLNIAKPKFDGKWGTTGSQLIYVTANDATVEDERVLLFGVDLQGKHTWYAQTAPLKDPGDGLKSVFSPERFEIAKDSMMIHGIYSRGTGGATNQPWTIRIPLSELKALETAAQQPTQK